MIQSCGGRAATRTFGELLIDVEEDDAAGAAVCGLLAEMILGDGPQHE
jgi:hypothetical protein